MAKPELAPELWALLPTDEESREILASYKIPEPILSRLDELSGEHDLTSLVCALDNNVFPSDGSIGVGIFLHSYVPEAPDRRIFELLAEEDGVEKVVELSQRWRAEIRRPPIG